MSDRIDTEAVREAWPIPVGSPYTQGALAARTMHALCDELDRTREALRASGTAAPQVAPTEHPHKAMLDAVHAEALPDLVEIANARRDGHSVAAPQVAPEPERCPTRAVTPDPLQERVARTLLESEGLGAWADCGPNAKAWALRKAAVVLADLREAGELRTYEQVEGWVVEGRYGEPHPHEAHCDEAGCVPVYIVREDTAP